MQLVINIQIRLLKLGFKIAPNKKGWFLTFEHEKVSCFNISLTELGNIYIHNTINNTLEYYDSLDNYLLKYPMILRYNKLKTIKNKLYEKNN